MADLGMAGIERGAVAAATERGRQWRELAAAAGQPAGGGKEVAVSPREEQRLRGALADFEAMFIKQMQDAMRKTVPEEQNKLFGGGQGEKMFKEMLDQRYAELMSKRPNGLGLKESMYKQMMAHHQSRAEFAARSGGGVEVVAGSEGVAKESGS